MFSSDLSVVLLMEFCVFRVEGNRKLLYFDHKIFDGGKALLSISLKDVR